MLLLGLVIIAVGVVLVILGVVGSDVSGGEIEYMGIEVTPTVLFLLGLVAGVCILFGTTVTRFGAKRELRQRREQKKLDELSEKLDRAEAGRRRELDEDRP